MTDMPRFPSELMRDALLLANEYCWPPTAAWQVVDWLSREGWAVVGVEVWRNDHGQPHWIASSAYDCRSCMSWPTYIACCCAGAQTFIDTFSADSMALFNLSWTADL